MFDSWYYTPGWGALGTVTVAVIALITGVAFNIVTLRRAKTYATQSRQDAKVDKLRTELATYISDIEECRRQSRKLGQRLTELSQAALDSDSLADDYKANSQRAFQEIMSDIHDRLAIRSLVLMMLTADEEILRRVSRIEKVIEEDRNDFLVLVLADKDRSPASLVTDRGATMLERHDSRYDEIWSEVAELGEYCVKTFPMDRATPRQRCRRKQSGTAQSA